MGFTARPFYVPDNLPGNVCAQLPKSVPSRLIPKDSLGTVRSPRHTASVRPNPYERISSLWSREAE